MKSLLAIGFSAACIVTGCSEKPENVAGKYSGHYANATEILQVGANGTFTQVLSNKYGIVYSNTGTWALVKGDLFFYDFIVAVDLSQGQLIKDENKFLLKPAKASSAQANYHHGFISTAPDTLYFFARMRPNP